MKSSIPPRFEIHRILEQSRSKTTFIGTDHFLQKSDVVVKFVRAGHFAKDAQALSRFFRWHRGIRHPNLAEIFDAGLTDTRDLYYVREFFGTKASKLSAMDYAQQLVSAITALHIGSQVHGHIIPANIFIIDGKLQLTDPSIREAKKNALSEEDIRFTAPEILSCRSSPTFQSDLYSLGALLYRIFSGRDPFDDFDLENLKSKHLWAFPQSLKRVCYVSPVISDLVSSLLEKDARKRPPLSALQDVFPNLEYATAAPYTARETELESAQKFLSRAERREGLKVVFVEGEAGIGKSRFLEEAATAGRFYGQQSTIIRCRNSETPSASPFFTCIADLLRSRAVKNGCTVKERLGNFQSTLSQHLFADVTTFGAHVTDDRVVSDVVGLLRTLSEDFQITLGIDDIDLANDFTRQIIQQMFIRAHELDLNLIVTCRTFRKPSGLPNKLADPLKENLFWVQLKPLDEIASEQVMHYLAPSDHKNHVLKNASGNPYLLHEYSKKQTAERLNSALDTLLLSILRDLSGPAATLSELVSLFPVGTNSDVLVRLCEMPVSKIEEALYELCLAGLVQNRDSTVAFRNDRFRLSVHSRIPIRRKVRLHRAAYAIAKQQQFRTDALAHHSLNGKLREEAAEHYLELANGSFKLGNYSLAITAYVRAAQCLRFLEKDLPSGAKTQLATCYARTGRVTVANRLYRQLSSTSVTDPVPGVESIIASSSADTEAGGPISQHIQACRDAIATCSHPMMLTRLYINLSQMYLQVGELSAAGNALSFAQANLKAHKSEQDEVIIRTAESAILLNLGKFKDALSILKSAQTENARVLAIVYNNSALCLEHLGNLRSAVAFQMRCQKSAEACGLAVGKLLCPMNLGAFHTKLGNFIEADKYFSLARSVISALQASDRSFRPVVASGLYVDSAQLQIQLGQYTQARENLQRAGRSGRLGIEFGHFIMAQSELSLCFGDTAKVKQLWTRFESYEVAKTDFFSVERTLVSSRLQDIPAADRCLLLRNALAAATKLGTKYQLCRVLNEMAAFLVEDGTHAEARKHAIAALRLAKTHGYKPLAAQALLTIATTYTDAREREASLLRALHAASDLGMPELIGESAYLIAESQYLTGRYATAEEYLAKSASVVRELLDGIPAAFRKKYLSKAWRKRGSVLLRECRSKTQSLTYSFGERSSIEYQNKSYFRALYRLTLSSPAQTTLNEFATTLTKTLDSIRRPVVVFLRKSNEIVYQQSRTKLTDDLRDRIGHLSEKSQNKIYFGSSQKTQDKDTVAWIPLHSEQVSGGIYVSCRQGEAFSEGELEFLTILGSVANAGMARIAQRELQPTVSANSPRYPGLIGESAAMRNVYKHIEAASQSLARVLIEGESGTGKEVVAKAIHQASARAKQPFIAVDCGAIPEGLIEAELFGAKKGSYTGASADRAGLFEAANHGTIFLDEISNMALAAQAKLLRVLQEREVRRIGETHGRPIDVRLIAATNASLERLVQDGRFRQDLLYRLNVLHVKMPPLRNRREDIPALAQASLDRLNSLHKTRKGFGPDAIQELSKHSFPGNVRELQNAIERAFFLARANAITDIPLEQISHQATAPDEVESWFKDLTTGTKDFWGAVHSRYKRRDISREKIIALVDLGLKSSRGSYKNMATMFRLKEKEYRRFMDFLRRNECLLDFRPYRKADAPAP